MTESHWRTCPETLSDKQAFLTTLEDLHRQVYERELAQDPLLNHSLGIQLRAYRRLNNWRLTLALTPWMLGRILVPDADPGLEVPEEWRAERRTGAPYQVLGPGVSFQLSATSQQAHLNYHPDLGHYLLQPLALNMAEYDSAEAVFEAWNQVIRVRDENMEKRRKECSWQKEISRREFFRLA